MKEVNFHGEIGWELTADWLRGELEAAGGGEVRLMIHSRGGDVIDGIAMMTALSRYPGKVTAEVEGIAASMAANVALVADELVMPANAYLMFHEAHWSAIGAEADKLERMAGMCREMNADVVMALAARTGGDAEDLAAEVKKELWLNGTAAGERGIAHTVTKSTALAARVPAGVYANAPAELIGGTAELIGGTVDNGEEVMSEDASKKFSIWERLAGRPEKELEKVEAKAEATGGEVEEVRNRLEALEKLVQGEVAEAFEAMASRQNALDTRQDALDTARVSAEAQVKAVEMAADAGVPERSVLASTEEESEAAPEKARNEFEVWSAMERGREKSQYFRANEAAVLRHGGGLKRVK